MKILDYKSAGFKKSLEKACSQASLSNEICAAVSNIIAEVGKRGDAAVSEFTEKFDGANINAKNIRVTAAEIAKALKSIDANDKKMIREAIACVKFYNAKTKPKNWRAKNPHGATVGENFYPIQRVGLYIPGGNAPLVSTVIMTATLAKIAGCPQICVCTPPSKDGSVNSHILAALNFLGIKEIYKVGGAQAIAAMGVGTKTIEAVDKIYGPGNAFVIEAKRQLFGKVGCDLLPGPSEVMIIADNAANPKYVAADLLSQAEHGSGKEKIFLACLSIRFVDKVVKELSNQSKRLNRAEKLMKIIEGGCYVIVTPNLSAAADVANYIAPEHVEIQVKEPEKLAPMISTAGAILIGENTPTVLGDFTAGPSHTLPTGRTGRFSSGLQVIDFMRRSSYVRYDKKSLAKAKRVVSSFGKMESLDAHSESLIERI